MVENKTVINGSRKDCWLYFFSFQEFMLSQDAEHELLFDLIEKMLQYDPAKRITLREALKHPFFHPLRKDT